MSTTHAEQHPASGQSFTLDDAVADPARGIVVPGRTFVLEDWWDRVGGRPWGMSNGNPAALQYALRIGLRDFGVIPIDDEVVYGHIDGYGHLLHVSELPVVAAEAGS